MGFATFLEVMALAVWAMVFGFLLGYMEGRAAEYESNKRRRAA